MPNEVSWTREEVVKIVESSLGKTLGELGYLKHDTKGSVGQFVEEELFQYGPNSKSEKDLLEANLELKVTPYKRNQNGSYSAKERLVLNIINYMTEWKKDFYTSSFWVKNSELIIIFYHHLYDKAKKDYPITHYTIYQYPEKDLKIIQRDWHIIHQKILRGEAHLISEADTMYLAACTKGVNRHSIRKQPFSKQPAKQRAYSLKSSFMTHLIRQLMSDSPMESLVDESHLDQNSFEDVIISKLRPFVGRTVTSLANQFNLNLKAKSLNYMLLARMLGVNGHISNTEEFLKANIVPKTIRLEENGSIREHMSFPTFNYSEIINQDWEDSDIKNLFDTTKFMFVIFQKNGDDYFYKTSVFWNMPQNLIDTEVRRLWEHTVSVIKEGRIVKKVMSNGQRKTNFIGSREHPVMHIRPHAKNRVDTFPLPVKDALTGMQEYTKQCFWLNKDYILSILNTQIKNP